MQSQAVIYFVLNFMDGFLGTGSRNQFGTYVGLGITLEMLGTNFTAIALAI